MAKRVQPEWIPPNKTGRPKLHLFNSLTRRKEKFVPLNGNNVSWYSCGPTVYDASHMGHARSYISFDILRRVLSEFFGYNILYVMNITDIDDKIIKRARQNHLYDCYVEKLKTSSLDQILTDQKLVLTHYEEFCTTNTNSDMKEMLDKVLKRMNDAAEELLKAVASGKDVQIQDAQSKYLKEAKDPIASWLEHIEGKNFSGNEVFENFPKYWEDQFHIDMKSLNILPPDVLTRVSEYIPQIIQFTERIISRGYAYVVNGSVYFDVNKFDKKENHFYAKLVPEAYGDTESLQEGEGNLSTTSEKLSEKHSVNDFALWKCSKAGEPWWESPWGNGRPGWHIECSAMASEILGQSIDIHTGGVDLKFPHHDNELAQSEAAFDVSEWVKYFLHSGHLTISGCKMSKSLKNFITIQEALKKNTSRQLRLAFLLHSWKDTLDYSENVMEMAIHFERLLNEFFLNIKDLTRHIDLDAPRNQFNLWSLNESLLNKKFNSTREKVYAALCDNVDTRSALDAIRELVSDTNIYIRDNKPRINCLLARKIASYMTDILHIFGAIPGPRGGIGFPVDSNGCECNFENIIMPYAQAIAVFRNEIRDIAKSLKAYNILKICDELRDDVLPNLGVRLEDKDSQFALKLVDRDQLLRERQTKVAFEKERELEKERRKIETLKIASVKEAERRVPPKEMFLNETDKYSAFDENGLPTLDKDGKTISKGLLKKLQKIQKQQQKHYEEYLDSLNKF